jgi:2-amino-4-hydroxy-6-hydroxymethyldihydropteridine diphosphokinase
MNKIFLLLGSNLGDRSNNLDSCLELLKQRTGCIVDKSSVYETEPWGTDVPLAYLNMVVVVENDKTPGEMLESILLVEKEMGRERGSEKNAPRTVMLIFFSIIRKLLIRKI